MPECTHLGEVRAIEPRTPGAVKSASSRAAGGCTLRLCLACGHVGCCDDSPGKHATRHFGETAHPIIRSFEPGEDWGWCYVDEVMMEPAPRPKHRRE